MRTSFLLLLLALLRPFSTLAQSYCNPSYTAGTSLGDFIDGVVFGTINNVGSGGMGGPAYNDYTTAGPEFVTLVNPGDDYPITITAGAWDHGVGTGVDQYSVWIDLDRDGSFSVAEKLASAEATTPGQTLQLTISIPLVLHGGYTRMRVMCTYDTDPNDACGSFEAGETEDYALVIDDERPCTPLFAYGPADGDYIQDVQFEGIQQLASGAPAPYTSYVYADTGLAATVQPGWTYPITIRSGVYDPQDAFEYYSVWVDLDRSGSFDPNEKLAVGTTDAPFQQLTLNVPIPANAPNGYTWMRVLCTYEEDPAQGCGPFNYGEAEDYTLIIANGDLCIPHFTWQAVEGDYVRAVQIADLDWYAQLTPPLWGYTDNTIQGAHLTAGSPTQLQVTTGTYVGYQHVYVWIDYGLDGSFQYDLVEHQIATGPGGTATFSFNAPMQPGYYRLRIACSRDTLDTTIPCMSTSGYGNAIDFALAVHAAGWPCMPLQGYGTQWGDGMELVTFNGYDYGQAQVFPYYTLNTEHENQLQIGQNYIVTIVPDSALDESYLVALDMNDDGTFDPATEVLAQQAISGSNAPFDLPFTTPALCPAGQHILRVRSQFSLQFNPDPCADNLYGEIVDIAVVVSDPDGPCIPFVGDWTT
ncbi:MAG: GEVED domain-containing protein, partial [Flavobacteriales bacterium]